MLNNIKVLSFTHFLQGPSAVQILADLGADVIKVETTKGAYERTWSGMNSYKNEVSVFFMLGNRNQRSLSIDLRSGEGKAIINKLVAQTDVIIENFRPGAMERLGLGYEAVKAINPAVIYCSCSGYGSDGPYRNRPGQDMIIQSLSGLVTLSGRKETPPTPIGTAAVDQHAAVLGALGVITALFNRERTGKGCKVDSCLLNAALDLQIEPLAYYLNQGELHDRSATGLSSRFHQAPYGVYQTSDGWITVSNTPVEKLADLFHSEELSRFTTADQMSDKRFEIDQIFSDIMKERTTDEWIQFFTEHEIWFAPVNQYSDVVNDPQVKWNEMILSIDHPDAGEVKFVNHPIRYDGKAPVQRMYPPGQGEHSKQILRDLGYTNKEIEQYVNNGVIVSNERKSK